MIFNNIFCLFMGVFIDILNNLGIKITVKKFLIEKQQSVILLSLMARLLLFGLMFYVVTSGSFRKAVFFVFGFTLSKVLFVIKNWRKNENINR